MARKAGKGESTKTETLTVRINPKIKYGLELQARKQHRTLAGVVEWAIEEGLRNEKDGLVSLSEVQNNSGAPVQVIYNYFLDEIWDVEEVIRLQKLRFLCPHLMTYEEEKLWDLISQNAYYWRVCRLKDKPDYGMCWNTSYPDNLVLERVNSDLGKLKQIISENLPTGTLENWLAGVQTPTPHTFKLADEAPDALNKLCLHPLYSETLKIVEEAQREYNEAMEQQVQHRTELLAMLKEQLEQDVQDPARLDSLMQVFATIIFSEKVPQ